MKKLIRLSKYTWQYENNASEYKTMSGKDIDSGVQYTIHYIGGIEKYEVYANDKYIGDQDTIELQVL